MNTCISSNNLLLYFLKTFLLLLLFPASALSDSIDYDLKDLVKNTLGLTGNPLADNDIPDINQSKLAQLGRELFFSKSLSLNFDVACASCHHPFLAGGDGLSLSIGVNAIDPSVVGLGRRHDGNFHIDPEADGGPNVERNAPTTFNSSLYQHAVLNDGRVERILWQNGQYISSHEAIAQHPLSLANGAKKNNKKQLFKTPESLFRAPDHLAGSSLLQAQARLPVIAAAEMRGFSSHFGSNNAVRAYLAKRLQEKTKELKNTTWEIHFRQAFNDDADKPLDKVITFERITLALAQYQSSQVFLNNSWRAYLEDRGNLSTRAKKGALLFYTEVSRGGAGCVSCHSGDFFTTEKYFNLAIPQFGRGNFVYGQDLGRHPITRRNEDMYAFRVPSLLNVAETSPYGHTGAFNSLEGIIEHHINPEKSIQSFDFTLQHLPQFLGLEVDYPHALKNTNAALQQLKSIGIGELPSLNKDQIGDLVAFLKTLTDPCLKDKTCLSPWVPAGKPADSHRLVANIPQQVDNTRPLPPIIQDQKSALNALPYLGRVPAFFPICQLSNKNAVIKKGFSLVTEQSGLSANRQFNFDHLKTSLSEEGLVVMEHLLFSGGVAAGDINGDCYTDILISEGNALGRQVYLNNGDGTFTKEERNLGIDKNEDLSGAMLVDLNGDGWLDLFHGNIIGVTPGVYLNNGQPYFNRIAKPGFKVSHVTLGAGFGDVDGDGDLDAFLAHWARPSKAEQEHLWLNNGQGLFSPGARSFGLSGHFGERDFTFTPNFADLNGDSKVELLSVSDFFTTQVFLNKENSFYINQTDKKVITDQNGMGSAIADFDNDGDLDWFVTSIFYPKGDKILPDYFPFNADGNRFYRNDSDTSNQLSFSDITDDVNVRNGGWGWGACAKDFDNDGWVDIFQTNGVPYQADDIRKDLHYLFDLLDIDSWQAISQYESYSDFIKAYDIVNKEKLNKNQINDVEFLYYLAKQLGPMGAWTNDIDPASKLFMNNQQGKLIEQSEQMGIANTDQGRGVSCFDFDRDGDIDILIINNQGKPALYRNDFGSANNFLTIKLVGKENNIHAIGAKIYVDTQIGRQMREVRVENNYLSQNPIESHFGLGKENSIKKLTVIWPDGSQHEKLSIPARQILVIKQ
ncbi:MAG: FG-GAP-like repeat-containing protein [Endozoicomonas sp. (ex Botrylloides leachii)]|nr:FG-GAP-like repeat-containing protein [Endozoicomonas sp. (ex Botrylloides leachii)]